MSHKWIIPLAFSTTSYFQHYSTAWYCTGKITHPIIHPAAKIIITGKGEASAQLRAFLSGLNEREERGFATDGFHILKALVSAFVRHTHLNTCTSLFLQQRFWSIHFAYLPTVFFLYLHKFYVQQRHESGFKGHPGPADALGKSRCWRTRRAEDLLKQLRERMGTC